MYRLHSLAVSFVAVSSVAVSSVVWCCPQLIFAIVAAVPGIATTHANINDHTTHHDANLHMARMISDAVAIANAPTGHSLAKLEKAGVLLHYESLSHSRSGHCPQEVMDRLGRQMANVAEAISVAEEIRPTKRSALLKGELLSVVLACPLTLS